VCRHGHALLLSELSQLQLLLYLPQPVICIHRICKVVKGWRSQLVEVLNLLLETLWHVAVLSFVVVVVVVVEGPIQRTREGGSEWEPIKILLEGDGDSNKMNTASNTRLRLTTQVGQVHAATEVLLDLGTNKQPSEPKHTNTHSGNLHGLLPELHRSDRWPAPVRPVESVGQAGGYSSRTTSLLESLSDFSRPWNKTTPKTQPARKKKPYTKPNKTTPNRPRTDQQHQDPKTHESSSSHEENPTRDLHRSDRSRAPVRPV
jgi:hypothetical protein